MKSKKYWERRAEKRMYEYQNQADLIANDIAQAYISATNEINEEIKKIFHTFKIDGGLSENEAYKLLNNLPDSVKLSNLKAVISRIKNPDKRREILNIINAPAYAYRIRRLEVLQQDIDEKTKQLADIEQNITKEHYIDLANTAYARSIFDIQKGTGFLFSFSSMPLSRIEEILRMNWSGQLFSKRIWGNTADLNQKIKQELLTGFMTGRSYAKTAAKIQEQMQVRAWEARRLVRTESTYIANMAELESYKECGIKKYRFVATLDLRTSDICRGMDGKEYDVEKAMSGVNLPPLHPWCRSTTIAVIDSVVTNGLKRRARDPKTGKTYLVPANMTHKEWQKTLQSGGKDDIINKKGGGRMDIEIDKFSPCLIERKTGKIINTSYGIVTPTELKTLRKSGWLFNWQGDDLKEAKIYKLTVENTKEIQGLVAITDYPKDSAFYVNLAESAPHNRGVNKEYEGVGGHLFAIAASESMKRGYDGYLFLDAKNMELVQHYAETLGAQLLGMPHPYRMVVDEIAAKKLLKTYTLKEVK